MTDDNTPRVPAPRRIDPERGIENVSPFYFTLLGTCLSFVLVLKASIAYARFWEARGHAGDVCHCLRGLLRELVFTTNVTAGRTQRGQDAATHSDSKHHNGPTACAWPPFWCPGGSRSPLRCQT